MKVKIKKEIAERLQQRVKETDEFKNMEEYVNYVLAQVVERLDEEKESEENHSKEDEEKVKQRLRALGYLD